MQLHFAHYEVAFMTQMG